MPQRKSLIYVLLYIAIGFLYPAYCSIVAIDTKSTKDDTAWLMYWVVLSFFTFVEFFGDYILSWFPLYPVFKLGFLSWCVAPIGENGAFFLYKAFIQPFFRMYGPHIDYYISQAVKQTEDVVNTYM